MSRFRWALGLLISTCALAAPAQERWRPPRVVVADARVPVRIEQATVQAEIAGRMARTQIELVLRNPNDRVLEASLEFPLQEGQSVSGFALDIGGQLRAAVPVEKARGQQVFEEITRRNVDPALLERTAGNAFRLRVYPLPAQGTRRVVLQLAQALPGDARGQLQWQLPLDFGQRIGRLDVDIALRDASAATPEPGGALRDALVGVNRSERHVSLRAADWQSREPLALQWRAPTGDAIVTSRFEGRDYFSAELPAPEAAGQRRALRELTLIWDASGSGAERDHAKEFALLDQLVRSAGSLRVHLVVARNAAEPVRDFDVAQGDWRALREVLRALAYDGASSAAAWQLPRALSRGDGIAVLVSDGLANWGDAPAEIASDVPLFTVHAAQRADADRLRALADRSGGRYLDLSTLSPVQAAQAVLREGARLDDITADGADQLVSASVHPENGRIVIAGTLTQPEAAVTLHWRLPRGARTEQRVRIRAAGTEEPGAWPPLAAQRWADLSIAHLEADRARHRAAIRRLGQQFGRLTRETSLIVLDSLADYLRYEIVPPRGEMREAYERNTAQRDAGLRRSRSEHLDRLAARFAERTQWWDTAFPKDTPPKPKALEKAALDAAREQRSMASPPPSPIAPAPAAVAGALRQEFAATQDAAARKRNDGAAPSDAIAIRLQPWQPDAPYARRLREARDDERYAIYLDERAGRLDSTAFFIDAADVFFEHHQDELAVRVLSNLAEMALENRHLLRVLAYRLEQAGRHADALPQLERVRELAPEEPQSWRDLGLACAAAGQPQRAIDLLWETASRPWDARFADIDLIALGELNALAARTPGLNMDKVDARLRRNLPLAVRALLTWDADNTDIDLWVIDPNGERAYYGHPRTWQGGRMSRDFTAGYGPEEFALRDAKPGHYEVRAQFFGHRQQLVSPYTTLMLTLSTGFGTAQQRDEQVVLRLSGRGEQVLVGSFDVPAH